MTQTIKELNERKSVRVFLDKEISSEAKAAIINAACQAPTAGNQQLYTIIDVISQEIKEKLVKTCDNQQFIASAKMVLIFCADCKKWYDGFKYAGCDPRLPDVGDLFLAISDANIAAENAVVAAESLGIGSCYIGDIMENCEEQRKLLHLPKYVFPAAMLVFGYPTEQQKKREKPRRADMHHIVHENGYREIDSDELCSLFSIRTEKKPYSDYMKAFCERKYNSDFSREMSRSVRKYLEQFLDIES